MSCIACDSPKHLTNILRDEELKENFENLTGVLVATNIFLCDPCCRKLLEAITFRDKCIENHSGQEFVKYECFPEESEDPVDSKEVLQEMIEEHLEDDEMVEYEEEEEDPLLPQSHQIRYRYTFKEKLEAIAVAENIGNRGAEKKLSIGESCIRKWRSQKEDLLAQENLQRNRITKKLLRKSEENDDKVEVEVECHPDEEIIIGVEKKEVKPRKSYTSSQKLEAVAVAELNGNRKAAKEFGIDESCIRKWRLQKELLQKIVGDRNTKRKPNLRFPEVETRLKEFVMQKTREGKELKPNEIKAESIKIAQELNETAFKGTSSYIFKFMERYQIQSKRSRMKQQQMAEMA